MDLDAVTQQFGDNFGPRPDFFKDRTVDDLKSEFENLIDLEEVVSWGAAEQHAVALPSRYGNGAC
jgi:hypothetical protein